MSTQSSTIVQRLWNYCNVLRGELRLESRRAVPFGDELEYAAERGP